MSVFSVRDRRTLREMLEGFSRPVGVLAFVSDEQQRDAGLLLEELNSLTDGLVTGDLRSLDSLLARALDIVSGPTLMFMAPMGEIMPIELIGLPTGYQFGAFLNLLFMLNRGRVGLNHATHGALKNMTHDVVMEVVVSATCPHCPEVVRWAEQCAMANPARMVARIIDAVQHPARVGPGVEVVPYTRIWVDGQLASERTGMMSATQFWHLLQRGMKGVASG